MNTTRLLGKCLTTLLVPGTAFASQPLPFNQAAVKQSTAPATLGPNASSPYFIVRFALPVPPDNDALRSGSLVGIDAAVADHHHSPGFEVMPNGDVLMISFSGASGTEGGPSLRLVQARLRYGAEEFDMPEQVSVGGKCLHDLINADGKRVMGGSPILWREGSTVWMFLGGHQWQGVPQPPDDPRPGGFRVFKSMDNGATWEIVALEPTFSALSADSQPIVNAFRAPNGDMFVACDGLNGAGTSMLWRSSNNGLSWTDQGGRTSGRHSTIVPLDTSGQLLSLGGKDTNINGYMPQNISTNWGVTWGAQTKSPFPWLGANQRPSMIRLASGNLVMVGDSRFIHNPSTTPSGWAYGDAPYVALSTNNGTSWTIKALPVSLKHEHRLHKTLGYSTVRQAPNGVIHIFATMTHPCLHYELNEAWITTPAAGDIASETTGGTVQTHREPHPGGSPKATWSARTTTGGRYLLDGLETHYYADGKKQREVIWASGRRTGPETFWGPDGTRIWSWNHDLANHVSTWTHWWSNGQKRLESQWNTNPAARDVPSRNFRGLVANGTARHWNTSGQQTGEYAFLNGDRISPLGNHRQTFAASPSGWTGSNNTTNGNNFGWSSTTSWAQNSNATYMTDKGEIGGVFARSSTYRYYADTGIGTRNRTNSLRMSGVFRVANANFDGAFRIGYFNTSTAANNFIGLEIREPAGTVLDPMLYGSGKSFRAYLTVNGPGGTSSSLPFELLTGSGISGKAFDLIWTGNPDGSGTLSGSVQSIPLPSIAIGAGSGTFNAFGLLNGGMSNTSATEVTGECWFDNLVYDKGTVTTHTVSYDANGATSGSVPSTQTKPLGVNIPVSANIGNLAKDNSTFAGWNTNAAGPGANYAPGALYTANADTTLYAKWTAAATYNVTYSENDATGGTAPHTQIKSQGVLLTLATNTGNLTRTGFAFAGWNTATDGSGTDYEPGQTYTGDDPLALHAKWAEISTKTLKIMPMGDSITAGTIPGGYRLPLYNLLQGGGYTFDFVGNKTQSGDTTLDTNHWGQGGWQISATPATIGGRSYISIQGENRSGISDEMSDAISTTYFSINNSTTRNIILLHIGINDVLHQVVDSAYGSFNTDTGSNGFGEGQEWVAEGNIARLQALLNSINSLATSRNLRIEVILGTLCPLTKAWTGDPVSDVLLDEVAQYNSFISTVVPTMIFSNLSVKIVDQNTATLDKLSDGLHPNSAGYSAMAQVWFNAIGSPTTTAVTFDTQGGTAPSPANRTATVGSAYGTLPTTTNGAQSFAGWWTGAGGTGTEVTATTPVSNISNHTLFAKWTAVTTAAIYWDGAASATWGTAANWSTASGATTPEPAAVPGADDDAVFNITIANIHTLIDLAANRSAKSLTFNNTGTTQFRGNSSGTTARTLTITGGITAASGAGAVTISTGSNGAVNLILSGSQSITNNGSSNININGTVSGTSSPTIINNGAGVNYVGIGALQSTVGKIVQDSATSVLGLRANSSGFTGTVDILRGKVLIGTSANNFGTSAGQVNLGGSGAADATLEINDNQNITYAAKPIVLGTTSGALKIVHREEGGGVFTHTITGAISGTNNLTLETQGVGGDDKLTFTTGGLNNTGTITHIGDGSGDLTINSVIGPNVTGVIQSSATSKMILNGANTYSGDTTVNAGILAVNGIAIPDVGKLVIAGGKVDPSGSTETVATLFFGAVQQAAGTWGATGSGATNINNTHFTGTGVISVTTGPVSGFASWQAANSTAGGLNDDHDNDGVENGVEWFLGGNTNTTGFTPLPGVANTGGTPSVTWTKAADYPGTYENDFRVETSESLVNPWTPATEGVGAGFVEITGNNVKYTFPDSLAKTFARLVVTGP